MKLYIISKWFIGFKEEREYLENNYPKEYLPIINFKEKKIIFTDYIYLSIIPEKYAYESRLFLIRK
jgi:hypothetical protein